VGPRNHVLGRCRDPTWKGQLWGVVRPLKRIWSVCCGVCSKKDHSVRNNGMTADYNAFDWSMSHYIVPREKSTPCNLAFCQNSLMTCLLGRCIEVDILLTELRCRCL